MKLDSATLYQKVDSLMQHAIREQAFPGAQVLVAYQGKKVFHQVYGYHTYDSLQAVARTDMYDLASVTKIAAALPAVMKLEEAGLVDLDAPMADYWKPWRRRKDKRDLTLREILAHQAGLQPYIVFLADVLRKGELKKRFVRHTPHKRYALRAYDNLYVRDRFVRKIYRKANRSKVSEEKTYRYSGLTFLLFPKMVEDLTGKAYAPFLREQVYTPLGLENLVFLPRLNRPGSRIVPTEVDTLYRRTLTQGWVHDENASLMGGISGNAGLFGTADNLAVLMQCYADYGQFKGRQVLDSAVVAEYIRVQYPENENRRGLGFDKPLLDNASHGPEEAYPAPGASPKSFGHSGFTGTFVWADPDYQLVFIFLSNRVYPSREHRKLYEGNLRTRLHELFYQALIPNS